MTQLDFYTILPVVTLAVWACALLLVDLFIPKTHKGWTALLAALGLLLLAGAALVGAGLWMGAAFIPVNKSLWTPSYMLLTGGWSLLFLGAFHGALDDFRLYRGMLTAGQVADLIALVQAAGLSRIGFVTEAPAK